MARLAAAPIELTEEQHPALEAIVRKHTSPQQLVIRARLILLAAQGHGIRAIAAHLHIARGRVQSWRRRWLAAPANRGRTAVSGLTAARGTGHLYARANLRDRGTGLRIAAGQWPSDQPVDPAGAGR